MALLLPSYDIVMEIHDVVLNVSGGRRGIHVDGDIKRAVERPTTYTVYVSEYDIDTICALLIDSIARYHGFNDGNKRTALMTAMATYRINGVHFKPTQAMNVQFDALVMWVVQEKPEIAQIEKKLKEMRFKHEVKEEQSWRDLLISFVTMRNRKRKKSAD